MVYEKRVKKVNIILLSYRALINSFMKTVAVKKITLNKMK